MSAGARSISPSTAMAMPWLWYSPGTLLTLVGSAWRVHIQSFYVSFSVYFLCASILSQLRLLRIVCWLFTHLASLKCQLQSVKRSCCTHAIVALFRRYVWIMVFLFFPCTVGGFDVVLYREMPLQRSTWTSKILCCTYHFVVKIMHHMFSKRKPLFNRWIEVVLREKSPIFFNTVDSKEYSTVVNLTILRFKPWSVAKLASEARYSRQDVECPCRNSLYAFFITAAFSHFSSLRS